MAAPTAKLLSVTDPTAGAILLRDTRTTLGRASSNNVVLDDREVSKHHAEIICEGGSYVLCDLGSSNGTFVNGERILRHVLESGDEVEIGGGRYRFCVGEEDARDKVAILPASPIDKTTVLAAAARDSFVPEGKLGDAAMLRPAYERLRAAFAAVQELVAIPDVRQLCDRILDITFELLPVDTGAVLLFDNAERLVPWAYRGVAAGGRIVISRTIIDEVLRRRTAILAQDALTDARFGGAHSIAMSGVRSLLCVPLVSGERIFGILHAGSSDVGTLRSTDVELLSGMGAGAGIALANAFLARQLAEEARTRESLGRFLSPVVVEQVLQRAVDLRRGGSEAEVTVMFSDIRGFTPLTERSKAGDVVRLLNEYFDQMVEIVFRHQGILDKFIGDALMAVWGAPLHDRDDAARALSAGHEMLDTLASLNMVRHDRGEEPLGVGIGIATGTCVCGAIGARRRMEYTVIGDAVNVASRLAGLADAGQLLCDEVTYRRAGKPRVLQALPPVKVKGKSKAVSVFCSNREA